jgi:hypothetical protein
MSTPKTEKTAETALPLRTWTVYAQTEDNQAFGCGTYKAATDEAAIELGKKRAEGEEYKALKIKKFFVEETTELPSAS